MLGKGRDLSGQTFGRLTAIEPVGRQNRKVVWRCRCECGAMVDVKSDNLTGGHTTSCGCKSSAIRVAAGVTGRAAMMQHNTNIGKISKATIQKNNTSGVRGVHFDKGLGKYRAVIHFQKRRYPLGSFDSLEEAAAARRTAESKIYGDFLAWYEAQK